MPGAAIRLSARTPATKRSRVATLIPQKVGTSVIRSNARPIATATATYNSNMALMSVPAPIFWIKNPANVKVTNVALNRAASLLRSCQAQITQGTNAGRRGPRRPKLPHARTNDISRGYRNISSKNARP